METDNVRKLRLVPAPQTGGGLEWRPVTPDLEDGREILGMDALGRVRCCRHHPGALGSVGGWLSMEDCRDFEPLFFVPCPDRKPAIVAIFEKQQAKRGGK